VDDAICAVRASKDGGVVAGGGTALYYAMKTLSLDIVTRLSLNAPIKKILSNAGMTIIDSDQLHIEAINKNSQNCTFKDACYPTGYDVKDYKIVNMFDSGILDTAKGVKNALINAASASNNLIRTNNAITLKRFAKDGN
jgi:chaperonin GroEL